MKARKTVLIRDFLIFQLKLVIDGFKDVFFLQVSIVAVIFDLLFTNRRNRVFYKVMRAGERFELWLNLHGAVSRLDRTGDGLFGASKAGANTMLGQLEQMVRGGDEPRSRGGRPGPSSSRNNRSSSDS
jgi:hypothetical protein